MTDTPFDVVATGLNNPRGLEFGPDGTLYVAENGTGAEDEATAPCLEIPPEEPGAEPEAICYGATGSIAALTPAQLAAGATVTNPTRVVTGMPSLAFAGTAGTEAVGPSDVSVAGDGSLRVVVGLGADPAERAEIDDPATTDVVEGELFGVLYSADPLANEFTEIADIAQFEADENPVPAIDPFTGEPDPDARDSNPHSVLWQADGPTLVVDAGGNSLLAVDETTDPDTVSLAEAFPTTREAEAPPFIGAPPGTTFPFEEVPTSVEMLSTGLAVTQLTGFPFPVGEARVFDVDADPATAPDVLLEGFTNIADVVQRDEDGDDVLDAEDDLFVLEFAHNSLLAEEPVGAVVRVREDGTRQVLLTGAGLSFPGGIAVGPDGMIYLTNNGISAGEGQVLRFDPSLAGDPSIQDACDMDAIDWPGFEDIAPTVHEEAIACLSSFGVVTGRTTDAFVPFDRIQRDQVATVLANLIDATGTELPATDVDAFTDDEASVHESNINRLAAVGIISGRTATTYEPFSNINRDQLAALAVRTYEWITDTELPPADDAFTDDELSVHEARINQAADMGWVSGRTTGQFVPFDDIQRDQASSIIARVLNTLVTEGEVPGEVV